MSISFREQSQLISGKVTNKNVNDTCLEVCAQVSGWVQKPI